MAETSEADQDGDRMGFLRFSRDQWFIFAVLFLAIAFGSATRADSLAYLFGVMSGAAATSFVLVAAGSLAVGLLRRAVGRARRAA